MSPRRLLVLIVGPTSNPIAPQETRVVEDLNRLRSQAHLNMLQMGTMHFDYPSQAEFCRKRLGIERGDLVCVALVALDKQGRPVRALKIVPNVTAAAIDATEHQILERWSEISGVAVPLAALATTPSGGPAVHATPGVEILTSKGMLYIARRVEQLSDKLWTGLHNRPLSGAQDRKMRKALVGVAEYSRLLRISMQKGIINPKKDFKGALQSADTFRACDPIKVLPADLRPQAMPLFEALDQLRQAYHQLNG